MHDTVPDAEFRVVQTSRNRKIQLDLSLPVFQEGDGQPDRQVGCLRAFNFVAEVELIDEDVVLRIEFPLRDQIFHIEGELAFLDGIACIFAGVRGCGA